MKVRKAVQFKNCLHSGSAKYSSLPKNSFSSYKKLPKLNIPTTSHNYRQSNESRCRHSFITFLYSSEFFIGYIYNTFRYSISFLMWIFFQLSQITIFHSRLRKICRMVFRCLQSTTPPPTIEVHHKFHPKVHKNQDIQIFR